MTGLEEFENHIIAIRARQVERTPYIIDDLRVFPALLSWTNENEAIVGVKLVISCRRLIETIDEVRRALTLVMKKYYELS